MNAFRALRMLPVLALALAGCDAGQATDPMTEGDSLSERDRIALDVIAVPAAVQAAMDLVDVPLATAGRHGMAWGKQSDAQANATLARERFQEALRALGQQDSVRAAVRAREARQLVVRAMVAVRGHGTVPGLIGRTEGLAAEVGRDPGGYAYAQQLGAELEGLALQARERLQLGDSVGAGERAVLAEQRHRQRHAAGTARPGGAEVAVELGYTSVSLATRLVGAAGEPSDDQNRLLAVGAEYADAARDALAAGDSAEAVHLSDLALWTTLEAVVWPDGASPEEAVAMLDLAETLYATASATEPTGVAADLLAWARALIDFGEIAVTQVPPRGTGALWRAAVICTWIIG